MIIYETSYRKISFTDLTYMVCERQLMFYVYAYTSLVVKLITCLWVCGGIPLCVHILSIYSHSTECNTRPHVISLACNIFTHSRTYAHKCG